MVIQTRTLRIQANFKRIVIMRIQPKIRQEKINQQVNILGHKRCPPRKRFFGLEQQKFKIRNDTLNEAEDHVVGVQDVDVGGGLAQLDAGHDGGLGDPLGPVGGEGLLDRVDELLLAHVTGRTGGAGVGVVDLLQHLGGEDQEHHLERPDAVPETGFGLGVVVEGVEKDFATFG